MSERAHAQRNSAPTAAADGSRDAPETIVAADEVVPIPIRTAQPEHAELSAAVDEIAPRTPTGRAPDAANTPPPDAISHTPAAGATPPDDAAPRPARRGGKRFQIPKRRGHPGDASDAALGDGTGDGPGEPGARQAPAWCRAIYHGVDATLEVIHRPFVRIPLGVRNVIGACAAATIVVSLTAMYALPALFPRHDAIDFLEARIADLDRPKPAAESTKQNQPDAHAAPKPAADNHGGH